MKYIHLTGIAILLLSACSTVETPKEVVKTSNEGRYDYEMSRIVDPATGEVPENIRMRELAFASTLPKAFTKNTRTSAQIFEPIGPRNIGGRTRAVSYHVDQPNVVLAGGVSGGMWRSSDYGQSWKRATNYEDHSAVSCMIQDLRAGKTNIFYYGSGETVGNSATKSFSAAYNGSGLYKSTDHGVTWVHMPSTSSAPQKTEDWSVIFNVAVDNSVTDKDIVYAATRKGIMRSENGGNTWTNVLGGGSADFTNIVVTPTGIHYASISEDGSDPGFWRSDDGINWTNISPQDLPTNHDKTLIAYAPSNETIVYFYSATPFSGLSDCSFWKYTYLSGNGSGSGGIWQNRSNNLPPARGYNLDTQGAYCMSLAVKPNDPNLVLLGGTNLFRSRDAFNTQFQINQLGGYGADGHPSWDFYEDNQHPDQQSLAFNPHNADEVIAGTDGGVHFTSNINQNTVFWDNYNNGYQTTQFYGIGIDHIDENEIVVSGYQDNGSWWTNSADTIALWKETNGGDGSYCFKEGGADNYYFSSQYGRIRRVKVNSAGIVTFSRRATPSGLGSTSGFLFNHPYTLDPTDNNRMYMPHTNSVWRNGFLSGIDNNQYSWVEIATLPTSQNITAIAASKSKAGTVFVGTSNRKIYRIDDDGTPNATVTEIGAGITNGSYTSNIAVDPNDEDNILVVFSNYNAISIWHTTDGGDNWANVEGNLKGDPEPGVPPHLDYIGNGPSFRWARFIPTNTGNVILVGTSIGLFATNDLSATEVEWVQQAADVIGNVVIEMIDSRDSDGFTVIGTHGAGAYKTYFSNNSDITSVENVTVDKLEMNAYPNPVIDQVTIEYTLDQNERVNISVLNANGQVVQSNNVTAVAGPNQTLLDLNSFSSGMYYISIQSESGTFTKGIIKK